MDYGWLAGVMGFAFATAATPGPNNTMSTSSGASFGLMRTVPFMLGVATGVAAIMFIVAAFGSVLISDARVSVALKWIGICYLLWLAWKIATAQPADPKSLSAESGSKRPLGFIQGALLQLVNPKLWIIVGGAVVAYGQAAGQMGHLALATLFALVFGVLTFASTLAWATLGSAIGRIFSSPRALRTFNILMAGLLVASILPAILE